ncbi:MAG: sortase [Actinomycetota bacterium]
MSTRIEAAAGPEIRRDPRHRRRRAGRVLRILGILCLAGAVGVGGYLAWLLWGTGLTTKRHQSELRRQFEPTLGTRPAPQTPEEEPVHLPGDAVAILQIPRIDLDVVVVEGTDTESLKRGPGHYAQTAYPWQDRGRVGIAGHRTTYGHPFWSLDKLRPGDRIILQTEYGTFRYEVTRSFIIVPSNDSVLDQTSGPTLVLTTCNPRFSAAQRLIVVAVRL